MALSCGIVGLPNVGKSTIFNALTEAGAAAENFPFCTIEPNQGIVKVPDSRLMEIQKRIPTDKVIPATMEFTDIAGLVKGASTGEGLGNQFLGHIRSTTAIVHVVRCFEDSDVVHVDGSVDPLRDIEVINMELMLADLESVTKKLASNERMMKREPKEAAVVKSALEKIKTALDDGKPARIVELDEKEQKHVDDLCLITMKRVLYVGNILEDDIAEPEGNPHFKKLVDHAATENSEVVPICGKIEAELSDLSPEDKLEFLEDLGLKENGLTRLINKAYKLLGLATYFTAGQVEIRAWTIHQGDSAPQAAGVIHSDFERGFIKAEVFHYDDLVKFNTQSEIKNQGLLRMEGKEYTVRDGDIMHFRFNV